MTVLSLSPLFSRGVARRILKLALSATGCVLLLIMGANAWVVSATRELIVDDMGRLGVHDVGVVLGTSPFTRYGNRNLLFTHRMMAAAELYAAGHVRHLLLSGANPDRTYNEPRKMYQALRRLGVPDDALTFDFAGFRTLDSVVRAQRVFGLDRFVIISQRYHDYRALFIARYNGAEAVAYIRPQEDRRQPLRAETREYLARFKAVIDLFLLSKGPRFLGPQRRIVIEPETTYGFFVRDRPIAPVYVVPRRAPSVPVAPRPPLAYPDQTRRNAMESRTTNHR
ncbi:Vancomycin sensitivity protein [Salinisphaera shabanensis E1L3A]|uniref:Vancomycin sensitivity protein n=1 Tax=Salinisphaera shabanensis E1L3A TaxID=1033802 RepID=U2G090_9GAMM|nr:ElyC/SanA/YdcF family protein [Salinisphaera shabanensis]ERJ19733.1 Vancomycin sensitivity protein [Salinisphaera shabanensis E1L3A]